MSPKTLQTSQRILVLGSIASPAQPRYSGLSSFSYNYLQNMANRLHKKQKGGLAGGMSAFCDYRVTHQAEPTFLHINTLACTAGSTRSWRDNQKALLAPTGIKFFSYKRSLKLTLAERVTPLFRSTFKLIQMGHQTVVTHII